MGRSRVVAPEIVRLSLSGGDFLDVKKELNAGEYYDLLLALSERQSFAKIVAYVISWSLVGLDDHPIPYSLDLPEDVRRDTVRSLNIATVRELVAVLDRHEAAVDAGHETKKKTVTAAPGSPATFTSPDAAVGPSTTSAP